MKPIRFCCNAELPVSSEAIAAQILDLRRWPEFTGYGPLPGIRQASYLEQTPQIVGSRIQVLNTDGSRHIEEILEWDPVGDFACNCTPSLRRYRAWRRLLTRRGASRPRADGCYVEREFLLHPTSHAARGVLWLVSLLLRRAIRRHLTGVRDTPA